jgi:YD repeat-containing protein
MDFSVGGLQGFGIFRFYNSMNVPASPVLYQTWGWNWRSNFDRAVVTIGSTQAMVHRTDGKVIKYALNASQQWIPDADIKSILESVSGGDWRFVSAEADEVEIYNASGRLTSVNNRSGLGYTLTYSDGTTGVNGGYILDSNGNPTTAKLPANLLIKAMDSFGRLITFGYDINKHVTTIRDSNGGIYRYSYDSFQNLVSVTYPGGTARSYLYGETSNTSGVKLTYALTGIIDENVNRFSSYKYDSSGRAISTEHLLENSQPVEATKIFYTLNAAGNISSSAVTDALNTTRTYGFTNVLGVVKSTGASQPCNTGCGSASATTYDANGNISTKTDFNGNTTNYTYDLTRNFEISRTKAYGTPKARTITTQWHATYRLPTLITEPGKTTAFSYDASGNLLTKTITDTALNTSRTWS